MNSLNWIPHKCIETPLSCKINCFDRGVEIFINNNYLILDKETILDFIEEDTCLTTRLINLFKPLARNEIRFLAFLSRVISCFLKIKTYVLIDDSTNDTLELASLINCLFRKYGVKIEELVDIDIESIYINIKELVKKVEKYRDGIKYPFSNESITADLQEIDSLIINTIKVARNRVHIVEALLELMRTKDYGAGSELFSNVIELFYNARIKEFKEIFEVWGVEPIPIFVNLSFLSSTNPVSFRDVFNLFDSYMRREGCKRIVVVDGDEYEAIAKLLKLNWKILVSPS
ncbi:MAG: hypothetical protein QXO14_00920 [Desulfurococcaceae archaeon]